MLYGTLLTGVVDGVVGAALAGKDELGDRDESVPFLEEGLDNAGQGFRGVLGGIVEEHDGAGLYLGGDPLGNLGGREVFPVQTIPHGSSFKWSKLA